MDKVVQQNAANAKESAAASEQMNAQAETMKAMVNELGAMVGSSSKAQKANSCNRSSCVEKRQAAQGGLLRDQQAQIQDAFRATCKSDRRSGDPDG